MELKSIISSAAVVFVLVGCSPADAERSDTDSVTEESPETGVTESTIPEGFTVTASGLQYQIIEEGTGPRPQPGDTVSVHYRGTLEDGTEFDESYGRGEPLTFPIGRNMVIAGWEEGIALLNEGSKAILRIPPELGYGAQGRGDIPPNATLIFEVELVAVSPANTPATPTFDPGAYLTTVTGLQYRILEEGTGPRPEVGDTVVVHYRGTLEDGTEFDSSYTSGQPFMFVLGVGEVIPGWDEGIALLNERSRAELRIPPDLGYGAAGAGGVIPPNATLIFEVELVEVIPAGQ